MRGLPAIGLLILIAFIFSSVPAAAKAPVDWPAELAGLPRSEVAPQLVAREGHAWRCERTGSLQAAYHLNEGPFDGGAEAAARAFLAAWAERLGIVDPAARRLERVSEEPGGWQVRFLQTAGGVPVWRGDLVVALDPAARFVRAVMSHYDPFVARGPERAALLSPGDALDAASRALGLPVDARDPAALRAALTDEPRSELWIVRQGDVPGGAARPAYKVYLPAQSPAGDWLLRVDAETGAILGARDSRVFVDGSGYTFDPDPLTTAEVNYGGNYADNNDADTAELNAERVPNALRDLTYSGGVYHLNGPFVRIVDFEAPSSPPVTSPDPHGFVYTRSQQGFEDVNVYYHIDNSQRHIQSLGFFNIQNLSIVCDPHGVNGQDNSYYSPGSNRLSFGEGGVDDAEDADVILHEYGHAIQHAMVPGWGGGEAGSIGEGFGDYWAGSHSASVSSFRDYWVFNWDGHNNFWDGRILNSTMHYPEDMGGSIHSNGQIWSAPLMQSWREGGREVMDRLILKSHGYLGSGPTMPTAAAAIMQADLDLYDGLHAGTLDWFFTRRGFFRASDYIVPEIAHAALTDTDDEGPYPVVCTVASSVPLVAGSVRVVYGIDGDFAGEAQLAPTGNPNEYAGEIPSLGGDIAVTYYIKAKNTDGWQGTHPRGAEHTHHAFRVTGFSSADGPAARADFGAWPNPAPLAGAIHFTLAERGEVRLALFDPAGRLVRTLQSGEMAAGAHSLAWDGRNEWGTPAGPGVYFARLQAGGGVRVERLVLTR